MNSVGSTPNLVDTAEPTQALPHSGFCPVNLAQPMKTVLVHSTDPPGLPMPLSPDPADRRELLDPPPRQLQARMAQPAAREDALRQAPGRPVLMLRPAPVKVGSTLGQAVAYTVTHVLVEWENDGGHDARWLASWLVRRL